MLNLWELLTHSQELQQLQSDNLNLQLQIQTLEAELAYSKSIEKEEYELDMPKISIEKIKSALHLTTGATVTSLIEYLNIDNYEIIKSIAKVTNKENFSNTIAFRDGALGRNSALIKILREVSKEKTFINREEGKEVVL